VVTLALLDPLNLTTALQWWNFKDKTEITIGRSSRNDIVVPDPRISRHHVLLSRLHTAPREQVNGDQVNPEQWQLTNQGKNNVCLNGRVTFRDILPEQGEIQLAPNGPRLFFCLAEPDQAEQVLREFIHRSQPKITSQQDYLPVIPRTKFPPVSYIQPSQESLEKCQHLDNHPSNLFCSNCGKVLSHWRSVREYNLLKVLSEGEESSTYLASIDPTHPDSKYLLGHSLGVIKQLNPNATKSQKDQELFMRQAITLSQLDYPAIPHFLDFFSEAHQFYLVMEWIPGQNLSNHVRERGPLTPEKSIACGLQVCNVLEYLQQQNPPLIHRDIKPSNLILRHGDGRIVLVDFGVVKPLSGLDQTRLALGGYRAPEQLQGQTFPQSDFFSLGATIVYLLTGRNPVQIHQYRPHTAQYYVDAVPGISLALGEVLRCLLHPSPSDRYPHIQALKEGLKSAQRYD